MLTDSSQLVRYCRPKDIYKGIVLKSAFKCKGYLSLILLDTYRVSNNLNENLDNLVQNHTDLVFRNSGGLLVFNYEILKVKFPEFEIKHKPEEDDDDHHVGLFYEQDRSNVKKLARFGNSSDCKLIHGNLFHLLG